MGDTALPVDFAPSLTQDEADALCERLGLSLPVHTLVPSSAQRRKNDFISCHVWRGGVVSTPVARVSDGLLIGSPEMLFLQMASCFSVQELIRLGFDLCGTYRRSKTSAFDQEPLASTKKIETYLELAGRHEGAAKAKRALRFVRDGSFSPKETDLAMKLGLPHILGGEGLGMPSMNYGVDLSPEAAQMLGKKRCLCDLYWPDSRVDVEFNGYAFHHGREQNTHDRKRELALGSMGITVFTVTNEQLTNAEQFDFVASQIAKALGKRVRNRCSSYVAKRYELDQLLKDDWPRP